MKYIFQSICNQINVQNRAYILGHKIATKFSALVTNSQVKMSCQS